MVYGFCRVFCGGGWLMDLGKSEQKQRNISSEKNDSSKIVMSDRTVTPLISSE